MRSCLAAFMAAFLLASAAAAGEPNCAITPAYITETIKTEYPDAIAISLTSAAAEHFIDGFNQLPPPSSDMAALVLIFIRPGKPRGYAAIFDHGCKVDGGRVPVGILQELAGQGA